MWSASYHVTEETSRFILSTGWAASAELWNTTGHHESHKCDTHVRVRFACEQRSGDLHSWAA